MRRCTHIYKKRLSVRSQQDSRECADCTHTVCTSVCVSRHVVGSVDPTNRTDPTHAVHLHYHISRYTPAMRDYFLVHLQVPLKFSAKYSYRYYFTFFQSCETPVNTWVTEEKSGQSLIIVTDVERLEIIRVLSAQLSNSKSFMQNSLTCFPFQTFQHI